MVHTFHGVADSIEKDCQSTRSYVSKKDFEKYLRMIPFTYKPLVTFSHNENISITLDDATHAAAEACLMALKYKHSPVLFINPWQIINSTDYYFSILNAVLDTRRILQVDYENASFNLNWPKDLKHFRKKVKENISILDEQQALDAVDKISVLLHSRSKKVASHSRVLTVDEIRYLYNSGVQIESHGWSHRSVKYFSKEKLLTDLTSTKEWIQSVLGYASLYYAVPFGSFSGDTDVFKELSLHCFLADKSIPELVTMVRSSNRLDITDLLNSL